MFDHSDLRGHGPALKQILFCALDVWSSGNVACSSRSMLSYDGFGGCSVADGGDGDRTNVTLAYAGWKGVGGRRSARGDRTRRVRRTRRRPARHFRRLESGRCAPPHAAPSCLLTLFQVLSFSAPTTPHASLFIPSMTALLYGVSPFPPRLPALPECGGSTMTAQMWISCVGVQTRYAVHHSRSYWSITLTLSQPASAHSLLARLPLLDPYRDPAPRLVAFFHSSFHLTRRLPSKPTQGMGAATAFGLPEPPKQKWYEPSPTIRGIPALPLDLESASIATSDRGFTTSRTRDAAKGKTKDDKVDPNTGTLVVVADTSGALHFYLDGSYPLGSLPIAESGGAVALFKRASVTSLAVHVADKHTALAPALVELPLAIDPATRNVARASSTIRALLDYIHLGIEELALVWNGRQAESRDGVKDAGNYWAKIIQDKERAHTGRQCFEFLMSVRRVLILLCRRFSRSHRRAYFATSYGSRHRFLARFLGRRGKAHRSGKP